MDRNVVIESEAAKVLRAHISEEQAKLKKRGIQCLSGNQWVVIELIEVAPDDIRSKLIGSDKTGQSVSAPISFFQERQFCGIWYLSDPRIRSQQFKEDIGSLARQTKYEYALYNPYQHKAVMLNLKK